MDTVNSILEEADLIETFEDESQNSDSEYYLKISELESEDDLDTFVNQNVSFFEDTDDHEDGEEDCEEEEVDITVEVSNNSKDLANQEKELLPEQSESQLNLNLSQQQMKPSAVTNKGRRKRKTRRKDPTYFKRYLIIRKYEENNLSYEKLAQKYGTMRGTVKSFVKKKKKDN